jgi:Tol biopolymer transport system component/tRNA A-37 threonylcarbamoyl transferase component Bud32
MPPAGHKLGPYEILSPLGRGGMGEVWRARDSRLGRDVAIKISDQRFSDRFEREARAIAALNHPNICTLHDVGPNYLVMEIVEGPTLAERIAKGPIPLDEALSIAGQIAEALDAAHEKGIIHRDLKPANIKIRPDGSVKVLDFGLAKSVVDPAKVTSDSPTLMHSTAGTILGTAGYMSPEQARGQEVDKRSDIWAFGVVLFEMTTAKRLFEGPTVTDCLAEILKDEPDLTEAPPKIQRLLSSCLEKDPRKRLRDIGDWRRLLEPASTIAPESKRSSVLPWAIAAAAILVAIGLGTLAWKHFGAQPEVLRLTLLPPEKAKLTGYGAIPAISPDGRLVVFATTVDGDSGLWLRNLDDDKARLLPGTEDAHLPFWSPDSRWIAFFANDKLKKIDLAGGPPLTLCDVPHGVGGAWGRKDWILFVRYANGLSLISASGGTPTILTKPDSAASEIVHRAPWFLPDGLHFLYTARGSDHDKSRVYMDSIDARPGLRTRREILAVHSNVAYVPRLDGGPMDGADRGYLLYMRENSLMAQPFDAARARTTGDAVPVAEQVDYFQGNAQGGFTASANGILLYTAGLTDAADLVESANLQLTLFDRTGNAVGVVGSPAKLDRFAISPDGSMVAEGREDATGTSDIWLHDLARGTESRLTFGGESRSRPVWSPDGSKVGYWRPLLEIWQKAASGTGEGELLFKDTQLRTVFLDDWSHDGRYLIIGVVDPNSGIGIEGVPTFGDRKPFLVFNSDSNIEAHARLSPDGAFLAYTSDELKHPEVFVQTFPEHTGKWQISTEGGDWPVWSRKGHELYFQSSDGKIMAVDVKAVGRQLEAGAPHSLFSMPGGDEFDVGKDGRFLIPIPQVQPATNIGIHVIVNWQSALKK